MCLLEVFYAPYDLLDIERFHSRGQHISKFIGTKESLCIRKEFNFHRMSWYTNMAAVSLFWNTNMAAVTSCENTLYVCGPLQLMFI